MCSIRSEWFRVVGISAELAPSSPPDDCRLARVLFLRLVAPLSGPATDVGRRRRCNFQAAKEIAPALVWGIAALLRFVSSSELTRHDDSRIHS